ncbi:septal ring lytic transglycosylase RlpA family protein [Parashewanella curva]|uniref:Endolytic peptidoglycan transglycosylase RlpA n=1 Tax=Parashewanella curva TaxID=2338552 RepID=A0A3L8PZE4_9GAMM|nr:septal ring lytic transglycosylase RlpA family protein [Parashewanella curva]RLV60149.1 septal ring lytic transglycosylase RlpA family protein [Parashewanella curva]
MKKSNLFTGLVLMLIISGCSNSRYHLSDDKAPVNPPDLSQIENAHPRYEPHSRQGNNAYEVFNKKYQVLPSAKDYVAIGKASYYGKKFHGYHTSNGEIYDMYSMSAAHKSLPLPSYVKVTNLDNDKSVIVRVNDRGPFHKGRIIDVSYAAAYKLGMLKQGVANVKLEAIHLVPPSINSPKTVSTTPEKLFIQLVASKNRVRLASLAKQLQAKYQFSTRLQAVKGLYRLQVGPVSEAVLAEKLLEKLKADGYPKSFIISE